MDFTKNMHLALFCLNIFATVGHVCTIVAQISVQTWMFETKIKDLIFKGLIRISVHRCVYKKINFYSIAPEFASPQYQILFSVKKHTGVENDNDKM